jgi:tetratricopeptide (TPR) repeat protein
MKPRWGAKWTFFVVLILSLASCSRNPDKYVASGDKYFKAGRFDEAAIQYRNAVQINPKLAQAHYQLARAYLELKSYQPACEELRETVALDPRNSEAQLQLATLLVAGKKYDESKRAVAEVLAADPNNARAHAILGDQAALTGDPVSAIREYQTAIKLDPQRVETYASLATVFTSRGELSDAEYTFKQAVESNSQSAQARVNLGKFYFSQRKFAQAEAVASAASKLAPRDPLPQLMLAKDYVAEGNLAEAEKICAQLKTIVPDDPEAYRALALLYGSTGQLVKAKAELQSLQASKPKDPWVKAYLAETLLELNLVQEASVPTQELLSADPNDPRALLLKGRILMAERKYAEAQVTLENASKGAPRSAATYYFLGIAQKSVGLADAAKLSFAQAHKLSPRTIGPEAALAELNADSGAYDEAERLAKANPNVPLAEVVGARAELAKGNSRKAEQFAQAVLNRDPISFPALEILVKLYAQEGRAQEAVRRLSSLVSEYPQNAGLQVLLALSYFDLKDLQKSEASVRQAITLDRQTPGAHALLAEIDSAKGLTEQAVIEFRAEIEANPYNASSYLALARLYEAESKWHDAEGTLEKANAVDPSSPYVKNNLAYLYLEHGGDTSAALSLAREAKRALPDSPVVADTLGWTHYKLGSYELAITQLSLSTQKLPDNPEYQYHLGMSYLGAGRFEPAARFLQRALKSKSPFADAGSARAALDTIAKRSRK